MTENISEMTVEEGPPGRLRVKQIYFHTYGDKVPLFEILKRCDVHGMRPAGLDELLRMRVMKEKEAWNTLVWKESIITGSIVASGRSKAGNGVVVIAHRDHYLSSLDNVSEALCEGIADGTAEYPKDSFEALLQREDKKDVFVLDYKDLIRCAEKVRESDERSAVGHMHLVFGLEDRIAPAIFGSYAVAEGYRSRVEEVRRDLKQDSKDEKVRLYISYSLSSIAECQPLILMSGICTPCTDIIPLGLDSKLCSSHYLVGVRDERRKEKDEEKEQANASRVEDKYLV